jgi:hypothetical protein
MVLRHPHDAHPAIRWRNSPAAPPPPRPLPSLSTAKHCVPRLLHHNQGDNTRRSSAAVPQRSKEGSLVGVVPTTGGHFGVARGGA